MHIPQLPIFLKADPLLQSRAMKSFLIGNFVYVTPDPNPPSGDNNTATLRIRLQKSQTDFDIIVKEDYLTSSILSSLATFGGFWTTINGLFALIFGGGILLAISGSFSIYVDPLIAVSDGFNSTTGSKPLSAFGLIHRFRQETTREIMLEDYPRLLTEGTEEPGLVAFIRDRMIGLDILEDYTQSPTEGTEEPTVAEVIRDRMVRGDIHDTSDEEYPRELNRLGALRGEEWP